MPSQTTSSLKPWHQQEAEEVLRTQDVNPRLGLSSQEAKRRQEEQGRNVLPHAKGHPAWLRFLLQFHQPLIYILLAAALIAVILGEWVDAAVIFGVTLVNAIIGYIQENKALEALAALSKTMETHAIVLRDGKKVEISSEDLVCGDIVFLEAGDKIPADLRIIQSKELQAAEAALTGESLPVEKHLAPCAAETVLAERSNLVFASTLVTKGQGKGVVVEIGEKTEIGRISQLLSDTEQLQTPLTKDIERFSQILLYAILALAALTVGVALYRGMTLFKAWSAAVAMAVGAIPEGLPAAVTITLALGVSRMAKRRAIIRKLPAVETLGSTNVICSDKTGTLTQGQMTVLALQCDDQRYDLTGVGYEPTGTLQQDEKTIALDTLPGLQRLLLIGALCNDSSLRFDEEEKQWSVQGDPTEGALIVAAQKAALDPQNLQETYPRLDAIPFASELQYMATLHKEPSGENTSLLFVKGAVERLLPRCKQALSPQGALIPLDEKAILSRVNALASEGMRVLGFAQRMLHQENLIHDDLHDLVFVGLQAMQDPPREEVLHAIRDCLDAGIAVKMITGDHLITAEAIARKIHLCKDIDSIRAISGQELTERKDEIQDIAQTHSVFARVSPEQKLQLVEALQAKGAVVAMTGDGVNDAPALKRANIGIAMGITGTEVSKESADLILTDDNFATIRDAVEEGRGIFDNITKFIVWTLPTNLGEGLVILTAILLGMTLPDPQTGQAMLALPITPLQILWINMTTAVLLGLPLAFEQRESDVMRRPPRDLQNSFITSELLERMLLVGVLLLIGAFGLFYWEINHPDPNASPLQKLQKAQTLAVNVFVVVEALYLLNCRSLRTSLWSIGLFSNPVVWIGIGGMAILQALFTYAPIMNRLFGSTPLHLNDWGLIFGFGFIAFAIVSFVKFLHIRFPRL